MVYYLGRETASFQVWQFLRFVKVIILQEEKNINEPLISEELVFKSK